MGVRKKKRPGKKFVNWGQGVVGERRKKAKQAIVYTDLGGHLGCWVSPGPWNPRTGFFGWCTGGCWVTQAAFRWEKGV